MEKFSDIGVVRAAIERNQAEIRIANKQIAWAAQDKQKIKRANQLLKQTANEWTFELMVSLSHRRFCRLMGYE